MLTNERRTRVLVVWVGSKTRPSSLAVQQTDQTPFPCFAGTMGDNQDDANNNGDQYYNEGNLSYVCAAWAPILGFAGIASAVVFAST